MRADAGVSGGGEGELVRLVCGAVQEEDIARADGAREEDRRGGVSQRPLGAEMVVRDDELALATIERDATGREWEGEGTARCRDGDVENDVAPVCMSSAFGTTLRKEQRTLRWSQPDE